MVTTTIYIVSILVVLVLGAIVAWLMRKNAITLNKQLHQGNQDLKKQLQEAGGKVEKLSSENVNLKTQHATAHFPTYGKVSRNTFHRLFPHVGKRPAARPYGRWKTHFRAQRY